MIKIGAKSECNVIKLCDGEIENAEVLSMVFGVIIDRDDLFGKDDDALAGAIGFMKKYDMRHDLKLISLQLELTIGNNDNAIPFSIASYLGDWELCGRLISGDGDALSDEEEESRTFFGEMAYDREPLFDLRTWSLHSLKLLRPSILWALMASSLERNKYEGSKAKNQAMGKEFVRLMSFGGMWKVTTDITY